MAKYKIGDIVEGTISSDVQKICGGNLMYNRGGKTVIGCVLYSKYYKELYVTTDGVTYASIPRGWITDIKKISTWDHPKYKGWRLFA